MSHMQSRVVFREGSASARSPSGSSWADAEPCRKISSTVTDACKTSLGDTWRAGSASASSSSSSLFRLTLGSDTLGVKRRMAPDVPGHDARGSARKALEELKRRGIGRLQMAARARKFAKTTVAPMRSRLQLLRQFADSLRMQLIPVTVVLVEALTALLIDGGYRSGELYLSVLRRRHVEEGYEWTDMRELETSDCRRAIRRGRGPGRTAPVTHFELLWKKPSLNQN